MYVRGVPIQHLLELSLRLLCVVPRGEGSSACSITDDDWLVKPANLSRGKSNSRDSGVGWAGKPALHSKCTPPQ